MTSRRVAGAVVLALLLFVAGREGVGSLLHQRAKDTYLDALAAAIGASETHAEIVALENARRIGDENADRWALYAGVGGAVLGFAIIALTAPTPKP